LAPSKVNLFLQVLGKRTDGYHDIRSILAPVSLFDEIRIETTQSPGIETIIDESGIRLNGIPWPAQMPRSEDNLATRAAALLKKAAGYPGGARIRIKKNIPVAGGLGGGSSDAAAALNALNSAWRTNLPREELMEIGGRLGCDIPAMIHGGTVLMEGRGERVSRIKDGSAEKLDWRILLVNPGVGISTADIYSRYKTDLTCAAPADKFQLVESGLLKGQPEKIAEGMFNSLEEIVYRKYPLLKIMNEKIAEAGALGVLLSGSGATLLALVRDERQGAELESRIRKVISCPVWTCLVGIIS
jgi:4-diphosphocytidyl-2-C-methyl-D-erythritol kinase